MAIRLRDTPIQRKLMSIILLTSAVVLSLMCIAYILVATTAYKDILKSNIATLGDVMAANSTAALAFEDQEDAEEVLSALKAEENVIMAAIYKTDSLIFATYPPDTSIAVFPKMQDRNLYWFEGNSLYGFQRITQRGENLGVLYIKTDLRTMYLQIRKFAFIGLALILGSMFIAYVISKLLQGMISEPILELEQTAKVISEKRDYSVRAIKQGNDEIGSLTDAFNQMLTQIQLQNSEITSFNQKLEQKVEERTSELQHQKEFIETIINSSVDMIAVFDKEMNYIMINQRASEFYKLLPDQLIGKHLLEAFPQV
ncbi:MAG: CHASE sensor domain-containing protein, partial [Saprospiraceae bacterium]